MKGGISIVEKLKLLCDSGKVNVKCYRNRNVLRRHGKAIRTVAVICCGSAVKCNCLNKIAEIGVNRNGHGITDGGGGHIDGEATAGSSSIIKQSYVIYYLFPMSAKSLCVRNRNCRTALHLVSVHGVGVPAHKGVARSCGCWQGAVSCIKYYTCTCSGNLTAVCVKVYGVSVRRPLGVVGFCARCSGTNRSHSRTAEA